MTTEPTQGIKYDQTKPRYTLLPWDAIASVVGVLEYGARKYAPGNWVHVEDGRTRYLDAAFRHLLAWHGGEDNDPESGHPHLAHAACCVLFLLALTLRGTHDAQASKVG